MTRDLRGFVGWIESEERVLVETRLAGLVSRHRHVGPKFT